VTATAKGTSRNRYARRVRPARIPHAYPAVPSLATDSLVAVAVAAARRFEQPGFFWNWIDRAAALGRLGRADEARGAIERLQALRPDFGDDPKRYLNCFIFTDDLVENVLDGLREAGL